LNVDDLQSHCRGYPGVRETLYGHPGNILVFYAGRRKFAYFKTSEPERWRFSVRVSPDRFLELTDMPGVKPARYLARFHWVTIVVVDTFPEDYLVELVDASYRRALGRASMGSA
jgi:predicted DNA-binding protein (MmcQ/YjbR family)